MRFRSFAALGIAITLVGTAACTDNSGPDGRAVTGLYALTTVDGVGLPFTYSTNSNTTITLQSDVFTLNSNGTYSEVVQEMVSNGFTSTPVTDNEQGTWSQSGSTISFNPTNSTFNPGLVSYSGTLSNGGTFGNDVLVLMSGQDQFVYQHE